MLKFKKSVISKMNKFNISSFFTNSQNEPKTEIKIAEFCQANYGYYIWPCSVILANFVYLNKNKIFDSQDGVVLEIGAGTSLPSIVAKKFNIFNKIIVTDNLNENSKLFDLIKYTLELNEIELINGFDNPNSNGVLIQHFDWTHLDGNFLDKIPKIDFIIGSDYSKKLDLVVAIRFLIEFNNEKIEFYTTFQIRSFDSYMKLIYLLQKYSLKFQKLEIEDQVVFKKNQTEHLAHTNYNRFVQKMVRSFGDIAIQKRLLNVGPT
ncbi:methyltransferase 23 [Brachionus plicatilis]|uniref:Methyltransferase 23 n=1 Tax=Brachionus plicatilis TaxID=10195 RepID=A0A3M7SP34_BRAPC|nr:methyltransferase 23 [Brachionus plicatilis]